MTPQGAGGGAPGAPTLHPPLCSKQNESCAQVWMQIDVNDKTRIISTDRKKRQSSHQYGLKSIYENHTFCFRKQTLNYLPFLILL